MYPINRNRRLRTTETLRNLIRENSITANDFLVPLFVVEGKNIKQEIQSMPNYFKMSIDLILKEIKLLHSLGLKSIKFQKVFLKYHLAMSLENYLKIIGN